MIDIQRAVEEELAASLGKQIQESVDWSILTEIMMWQGWHRVQLSGMDNLTLAEIERWIDTEAKGKVKGRRDVWLFECEEDAVWFRLKWS